jgi:hypothetical protein
LDQIVLDLLFENFTVFKMAPQSQKNLLQIPPQNTWKSQIQHYVFLISHILKTLTSERQFPKFT